MTTVLNYQDFIQADGDELTTTSMQIAAAFGKRHDRVIDRIRSLNADLPDEFALPNFRAGTYLDANGQSRIAYRITRDGFALLVMGFTGKKALDFKIAYINAFNAMAAHIKNQREGLSYRRAVHELACKDSARRGSFHGKGLNERKQEKRELSIEEAALMSASNPPLFIN